MKRNDEQLQNRETNYFYANEDRRNNVKDYFKMIVGEIKNDFPEAKQKTCLDIGCATGDFLWFAQKEIRNTYFCGMDTFKDLLDIAEKRLPNCTFQLGNIFSGEGILFQKSYDMIVMSGVLYLFNNFETPFKNIIDMLSVQGKAYIFSIFNANNCQVEVSYIKDNQHGKIHIYSMQQIEEWCRENSLMCEFIPFYLSTEIEPSADPLRSYTVPLANGNLGIINGLDIWHRFYLLKIYKRKF